MYRCFMHFYFIGCQSEVAETIKEIPPLEFFSHNFAESAQPQADLISWADVILADLGALDGAQGVQELARLKVETAEIILLGAKEQCGGLGDSLSLATELWTLPMSQEELIFHFRRWQESYKTRKDLWQTSQYLETTINSIPSLVWYKTRDGIHEKVNDSFCRTVNKSKEQVQGQRHAYIWDVERDDPVCIASEEYVMRTEDTLVSDEIVQTKAGTMQLTTYKSPLYDLDGTVMGTVGVGVDVTREKAYEQEIVQKNEMLESLFTAMDCGVLCHSLDGRQVLSTNQAALKILGYDTQEDLVADGFSMIAASVLEEDKPKLRAVIHSLRKVGDDASIEYRVRHRNGEIHHVMGNVKLARDENWALFYQRFLLDVTAQKQKEVRERKERERFQAELVQALSVDFSLVCFFDLNSGKGQALRMDEELDEKVSQTFSGDLSLEDVEQYIDTRACPEDRQLLRQALSLEWMRTELAKKSLYYINYRILSGGGKQFCQVKAVRVGLPGDNFGVVLGFRSVDEEFRRELDNQTIPEGAAPQVVQVQPAPSGEITLEEEFCSISGLLRKVKDAVQAEVRAKDVELYIDATDVTHENVRCDGQRLCQLLLGLLDNAIKYTPSGGTVSLRVQDAPDHQEGYANYTFCIKDTGIGMNKTFLSNLFKPFPWERPAGQRAGLGMAAIKDLVDMMNGDISVKSKPGAGTEFTVQLPLLVQEEEPAVEA